MHGSSLQEPLGNGKGVFLSDMDEDEMEEYIERVDHGWGGFINKVKNLGK